MELEQVLNGHFAVLTVSDTCYKDPTQDRSGALLQRLIQDTFPNANVRKLIVPDELDQIQGSLVLLADVPGMRIIVTTGGTGFAPRDVTPEATKPILTKECPQLITAMIMASLPENQFAALTRGICGIRNKTLIMNFPGSEKAVKENFKAVQNLLPHALSLIKNDVDMVKKVHNDMIMSAPSTFGSNTVRPVQIVHHCPHATASGSDPDSDRNSAFPMIPVTKALDIIFNEIKQQALLSDTLRTIISPINIPPFRASIKDGYAMSSSGLPGIKRVLGVIHAGNKIESSFINADECFKINTGAPLPMFADCVIQVENTKVVSRTRNGNEEYVEILAQPNPNLDVRPIGHDLAELGNLFPTVDFSPVVIRSIMASVGNATMSIAKPKIAIISTGSELLCPSQQPLDFKIYDSNTIMIKELLKYFGFSCIKTVRLEDDLRIVMRTIRELFDKVDIIICSGGVSMGDRDFIKQVLARLNFKLHIGRVDMKPGKPFTFASRARQYFFGLPGNPVSAFVTFHVFALPAIRWYEGWKREKCGLAVINVTMKNNKIPLDMRPEYARATVTSKQGILYALITGDQISSRLQSICGADVLVHLPALTAEKTFVKEGDILQASALRVDFISKYE